MEIESRVIELPKGRLDELLLERGLSAKKFASLMGVHIKTVRNWNKAVVQPFSTRGTKLLKVLGLASVEELVSSAKGGRVRGASRDADAPECASPEYPVDLLAEMRGTTAMLSDSWHGTLKTQKCVASELPRYRELFAKSSRSLEALDDADLAIVGQFGAEVLVGGWLYEHASYGYLKWLVHRLSLIAGMMTTSDPPSGALLLARLQQNWPVKGMRKWGSIDGRLDSKDATDLLGVFGQAQDNFRRFLGVDDYWTAFEERCVIRTLVQGGPDYWTRLPTHCERAVAAAWDPCVDWRTRAGMLNILALVQEKTPHRPTKEDAQTLLLMALDIYIQRCGERHHMVEACKMRLLADGMKRPGWLGEAVDFFSEEWPGATTDVIDLVEARRRFHGEFEKH